MMLDKDDAKRDETFVEKTRKKKRRGKSKSKAEVPAQPSTQDNVHENSAKFADVKQDCCSKNWEAFLKSQPSRPNRIPHKSPKFHSGAAPSFSTEVTDQVAIDCEMVGSGDRGKEDILARVSVVNMKGDVLYDSFVKPMYDVEITDYRTKYSGVRPSNLKNGVEFREAQRTVANLIEGRIVVGHDLKNDFKVLYLSHPRKMIRDTAKYKPFLQYVSAHGKAKPGLKVLAEKILDMRIQQGEHNSVVDAKASMALYMLHQKEWEASLRKRRTKKKPVVSTLIPGSSRALLSEAAHTSALSEHRATAKRKLSYKVHRSVKKSKLN